MTQEGNGHWATRLHLPSLELLHLRSLLLCLQHFNPREVIYTAIATYESYDLKPE